MQHTAAQARLALSTNFYLHQCCPCEQDTVVLQSVTSVALWRCGPDCRGCVQIQSCDLVAFSIRLCRVGVHAVRQRKVALRLVVVVVVVFLLSPCGSITVSLYLSISLCLSLSVSSHQHIRLSASCVSWRLCWRSLYSPWTSRRSDWHRWERPTLHLVGKIGVALLLWLIQWNQIYTLLFINHRNLNTGQLLQKVHLEAGFSHSACLGGYSYCVSVSRW